MIKKTQEKKEKWVKITIALDNFSFKEKLPDSKLRRLDLELCDECCIIKVPKILAILKK